VVKLLEALRPLYPHVLGLAGLSAVVAGVWGALGWQAGMVAAGLPFAGFWMYGEARSAGEGWRTRERA
jgi:hypothetical protein